MQHVFRDFIIWFAQFITMSISVALAIIILVRGHRKPEGKPQQNS